VSHYGVTREAGPGRTGIFEQPAVGLHAAFMNQLAHDGLVLFAGPLSGTEHGRVRAWMQKGRDPPPSVRDLSWVPCAEGQGF